MSFLSFEMESLIISHHDINKHTTLLGCATLCRTLPTEKGAA